VQKPLGLAGLASGGRGPGTVVAQSSPTNAMPPLQLVQRGTTSGRHSNAVVDISIFLLAILLADARDRCIEFG
jgi:hypothetical protein